MKSAKEFWKEKFDEYPQSDSDKLAIAMMTEYANQDKWVRVKDRPLITVDDKGNWTCTKDGDGEFIAAVPYNDKRQSDNNNLWWIRHCVIEEGIGLCVVGDDVNEPAGWSIKDVTHYQPLPTKPTTL